MMQFLWRYVDDMVGKGLEIGVLAQFFFYSALSLVPMALPLAVLLASLITFGNFGERYELLAMKAAGISLLRIMRPLIIIMFLVCGISFLFQNVIGPYAEAKLYTLIISMRQKSPELDIPEGVFYSEIKGYNLYVKNKDRQTGLLYNVMIYNFSDGFENAHIILADTGKLEMTADKKHLYFHLYSGEMFENLKTQQANSQNVPYRRETFREKHSIIQFDSEFSLVDGSFMSARSNSKDMKMLQASIDSMTLISDSIGRKYYEDARASTYRQPISQAEDTLKIAEVRTGAYCNMDSLFEAMRLTDKSRVIKSASSQTTTLGSEWLFKGYAITNNDRDIRRHETEWYKKITLSLSCLIFFFIGAPLGAIIRKGGLGMPVVVSVCIFIVYYLIDNTGFKMARDGNWMVWAGMWTSTAVLAPAGAFLTYKSNNDSVMFNADSYIDWIKRIVGIRSTRNLIRKDVIISTPNYRKTADELSALTVRCENYIQTERLTHILNYLKLWTDNKPDEEMRRINKQLEDVVEVMSNAVSPVLLNAANKYPVIPVRAHVRPFRRRWLNLITGALVPAGLFFYFRITLFRFRLYKDLKLILKTNETIQTIIQTENNHGSY
jgi:lipopolysaccharide export system permease protein